MGGKGSGRTAINLDLDVLADLAESGMNLKETSEAMGVSIPTLSKKIVDLQQREGVLLQYRAIQSLHLTELQAQILDRITPDKIAEASLKDLVLAFKILKDQEMEIDEGKSGKVKGLLQILVDMEKRENDKRLGLPTDSATALEFALEQDKDAVDAEFEDVVFPECERKGN